MSPKDIVVTASRSDGASSNGTLRLVHGAGGSVERSATNADASLYYIDCPRCGQVMRTPFSRYGGPQFSTHFCGETFRPRKAMFLTAASGQGHITYVFDRGERVEPVFERWIRYWWSDLRNCILYDAKRLVSFRVTT